MASGTTNNKDNKNNRRRAKNRKASVASSHVAPVGQKDRVAQPIQRQAPTNQPQAPKRRRATRSRQRYSATLGVNGMTHQRSGPIDWLLSARLISLILLLGLGGLLMLFFQSSAFYVRQIEVGGLYHLTAEEVFTLSEVANTHLFWIDPNTVRENVLQSPSVADANVLVGWPPHLVQIEIRERDPALIWEQAGVRTWIDVRGRVMLQRTDIEALLRIVVEDVDSPIGTNVIIPQEVVDGALLLNSLYPELDVLLYNAERGLGIQDGRGWRGWYGTGTDMVAKENVYNAIVANLEERDIQPEFIDVGDINAPYYKVWWGRDINDDEPVGGEIIAPPEIEQNEPSTE